MIPAVSEASADCLALVPDADRRAEIALLARGPTRRNDLRRILAWGKTAPSSGKSSLAAESTVPRSSDALLPLTVEIVPMPSYAVVSITRSIDVR
jgi:hypothetical protein